MTDTTDQQAVTVAHDIARNPESIWLSPICDDTAHHGEGRTWAAPAPDETCEDCSEPWVKYVRVDLASVSSASAEPRKDTVAFVQEWMMSGDHEPDQWHRDFAAAIDARRPTEQSIFDAINEECGTDAAAWIIARLAAAASSEPVPATNQAGEVGREAIARIIDDYPFNNRARDSLASQDREKIAYRKADAILASLATQPATSQEGEAYQRGQEDMRERAAKVCDERGKEEQEGYGLNRAAQNYYRARNAVRDLPIFAATPTPPTLSEDLRDNLEKHAERCEAEITLVPPIYTRNQWVSKESARLLRLAAAALAQVKAS